MKGENHFNCDCIGSQQSGTAIPAASNRNQVQIWSKKHSAKTGQSYSPDLIAAQVVRLQTLSVLPPNLKCWMAASKHHWPRLNLMPAWHKEKNSSLCWKLEKQNQSEHPSKQSIVRTTVHQVFSFQITGDSTWVSRTQEVVWDIQGTLLILPWLITLFCNSNVHRAIACGDKASPPGSERPFTGPNPSHTFNRPWSKSVLSHITLQGDTRPWVWTKLDTVFGIAGLSLWILDVPSILHSKKSRGNGKQ